MHINIHIILFTNLSSTIICHIIMYSKIINTGILAKRFSFFPINIYTYICVNVVILCQGCDTLRNDVMCQDVTSTKCLF